MRLVAGDEEDKLPGDVKVVVLGDAFDERGGRVGEVEVVLEVVEVDVDFADVAVERLVVIACNPTGVQQSLKRLPVRIHLGERRS